MPRRKSTRPLDKTLFGKRHYKKLAQAVRSIPDKTERERFGIFCAAVMIDDNNNFDPDVFFKEAGVR